ncbi:hypothetical protein B0H19DRAFT_1248080 [Mycena capillaripes]|nr:hypothetical protein B0H19DRAFT_1248080 [Mycena capillaripes]
MPDNCSIAQLDAIRQKIPLLRSLSLSAPYIPTGQKCFAFQFAPSLRRVILNAGYWEYTWPTSFILPWEQVTSLTLGHISPSLFSHFIRDCPQLLYFNARIFHGLVDLPELWELRTPLRKLVLRGPASTEVLAHTFPSLLSLSIEIGGVLYPHFFAFLARSSRLEMLSVSGLASVPKDLVPLLLVTPSLRIVHFRDSHTATVTPKFHTPLVTSAANDPFYPVRLPSRAELNVERCTALDEVALLALIQARMERDLLFDPRGIERTRMQTENIPFDPEAELDYLNILNPPPVIQD